MFLAAPWYDTQLRRLSFFLLFFPPVAVPVCYFPLHFRPPPVPLIHPPCSARLPRTSCAQLHAAALVFSSGCPAAVRVARVVSHLYCCSLGSHFNWSPRLPHCTCLPSLPLCPTGSLRRGGWPAHNTLGGARPRARRTSSRGRRYQASVRRERHVAPTVASTAASGGGPPPRHHGPPPSHSWLRPSPEKEESTEFHPLAWKIS